MKTIRTIIATLSWVLLTFALVAWFSVRRNAAFIQRTIYQGFDQTFVVALVMGCAFLLISVILTVAIASTDNEEEEEEEEPERYRPAQRQRSYAQAERRSPSTRSEQPYRRVTRGKTMDQDKPEQREEGSHSKSKSKAAESKPVPRKREKAAERPDDIMVRRDRVETPRKREKAAVQAEPVPAEVFDKYEEPEETVRKNKRGAEEPETLPEPEPWKEPVSTESVEDMTEEEMEESSEPDGKDEEAEAHAEPDKEEETVRCVFCGSKISRDCLFCPNCGKKR